MAGQKGHGLFFSEIHQSINKLFIASCWCSLLNLYCITDLALPGGHIVAMNVVTNVIISPALFRYQWFPQI